MKLSGISLHHKILFSYITLLAVIGSMIAILAYEHDRIKEIGNESYSVRISRQHINNIHRHITELATLGESVMSWDSTDYNEYRGKRQEIDSLLQDLKLFCSTFARPEQIDTLRMLLADKEKHLHRIMEVFRRQEMEDSLIAKELPKAASQYVGTNVVVRKRKGIAGWFGKKDTLRIPVRSDNLQSVSRQIIAIHGDYISSLDNHTDSLRSRNTELNRSLYTIISHLDRQVQSALCRRSEKIELTMSRSFRLSAAVIIVAIILIVLSHIIIVRDLRRREQEENRRDSLIDKLQKTNSKNEELMKFRRRIMQSVTHELRSPLTAINGNAELLKQDGSDAERMRHLDAILLSSGRMNTMLDTLLNYFRLDSGKESLNIKPFRLVSIADTLEAEFRPQAESRHLAFISRNNADDIVVGDRDLILQIGSNLLSNAVKFTRYGSITLSTSYSGEVFTIEVEDTGSGMTRQQQRLIYRPFERLPNAATQDGFGLGLSIVRNLVKLMGGKISLKSEPGKGSRFTVRLPLERANEDKPEQEASNSPHPLEDISVIVLDNDGVQLSMTKEMLVRQGIDCDTCLNVRELLERMRTRDYDILITDLKMPDMNGYEVMELLRTSDIGNSRSIPIIVSTAIDSSSEPELLTAGFCGCLFKPFSTSEAALAISSCLEGQNHSRKIDLSALLAYGDRSEILKRLIAETEKEMTELRNAHEDGDIAAMDSLIHHLRSSWMLINAGNPLQKLQELIHREKYDRQSLDRRVRAVLETGTQIISIARKMEEDLWAK